MDILARWVHISTAAVAVGGLAYAYFVLVPSMQSMPTEYRKVLSEQIAARLKPITLAAIILLSVSGLYNLLRILQDGVNVSYHIAFGFKFLLAAHVLAILHIVSRSSHGDDSNEAKKRRLLLSGTVSSLLVLALGAYLRTLRG